MSQSLSPALACDRLQWLPAEASARRFVRLHGPRSVSRPTAMAMLFHPATRPVEVARVAASTRLLARAGLPVPEVFAEDPDAHWILQEDLGDVTLAAARARGDAVASAYSEAVSLLDKLTGLSLETSPKPPLDRARMLRELDQFARTALRLPEGAGPSLAAELEQLVDDAQVGQPVLCHRDYHSRNLLLHDGRVRWVDHQDALLGPPGYDRASLAYDPYVELADSIRDRIAGDSPGLGAVAVQRLAKAMGTYADKGGKWEQFLVPAARQGRRLLKLHALKLPLLDLAFASLAAAPREQTAS